MSTPPVAARAVVLETLAHGGTRSGACGRAGVSLQTFDAWLEDDPAFPADVVCAEAEAEAAMCEALFTAARAGDWRAALSWLKRRRPEDWGDRVTVDLDGQIEELMQKLTTQETAP